MAVGSGLITSYDNTYIQKTMITDRIIMADPYDIATISALGLDNASKFAFVNTPGRTYSWLEDAYPSVSSAAAATALSTETAHTTIEVGDGSLFQVGDVIQFGSDAEYAWVSSISSDILTVVRGFGSTTTATHDSTATVYIRYNARLEGADSSASPWTEVTTGTNASTILHKEVKLSRDDMLFPNYGIANLRDYRIDQNMDILLTQLNKIPFYGKRAVGTSSTARSTGGFGTFITTNATGLSSAALTRDDIDDEFQQIHEAGGKTDLIICDAWFQRKINAFYEGFIETTRDEKVGGMIIKQLMHPITGNLCRVIVDMHCPSGYAYLLDTRYVGYITIDPFFYAKLPWAGDGELGETVGEYGLVVAYNKAHSILSGYSTTS